MRVNIRIMPNDSDTIAKIVILDNNGRALMLKRSKHLKKYANKWDLPGGHLHENESIIAGLKREVKEETNLDIEDPVFIKKIDRTYFYMIKYNSQKIKLSSEHRAYIFVDESMLDPKDQYQQIALKAMEIENDKHKG